MAPETTADRELDDWILAVDREARRRTMVERAAASQRRGLLAMPLRFYFKVLEIGPVATVKLSWAVASGWVRQR